MVLRKWRLAGIILTAAMLVAMLAGISTAKSDPQAKMSQTDLYQSFLTRLAANLGIGKDKVSAALDNTKRQMLDEAVQNKQITREQADKIATRKDCGLGWLDRLQDGRENCNRHHGRKLNDMAAALGMTPDQLKAAFKSGKKLPQIIAGQGMTLDQFHQKMLAIKKKKLSKAVSEGKMTQAEADQILKKLEQHIINNHPAQPNN